jgi:hypothetical protein
MAFALRVPREVARIISSMHDPYLDRVRAEGGTPSARAIEASLLLKRIRAEGGTPSARALAHYNFEIDPMHPEYTCEKRGGKFVVIERSKVLSRSSSHPNIALFEKIHANWQEDLVLINTSDYHGEYEFNPRNRPRHPPAIFRTFVYD